MTTKKVKISYKSFQNQNFSIFKIELRKKFLSLYIGQKISISLSKSVLFKKIILFSNSIRTSIQLYYSHFSLYLVKIYFHPFLWLYFNNKSFSSYTRLVFTHISAQTMFSKIILFIFFHFLGIIFKFMFNIFSLKICFIFNHNYLSTKILKIRH